MNGLGMRILFLVGPTIPIPAPQFISEALQNIEVTHSDRGRSGFQITFDALRKGPADFLDSPVVQSPFLRPFSRIVLAATLEARLRVLMDGIITHQQLAPSSQGGPATFVVTGEDVSLMMDLDDKIVEHPAQNETVIAAKIIGSYAQYGLVPEVIPPPSFDFPLPTERTPVQEGTDLEYLGAMAARYGYVFYVIPGPLPLVNQAYWGPPIRTGTPQRALSADLGPATNLESIQFRNDAMAAEVVIGDVQDRSTNQRIPVFIPGSLRPPLAREPAWIANQPYVRKARLRESGLTALQAFARAQGMTEASGDVVTAEGEIDALRYGDMLQARSLVGVRGVGETYDGLYYVKRVSHSLRNGSWKQRFSLAREGVGTTTPVVPP